MILFHNIVEVFDLADGDRRAVLFMVALDGRFIGRTPVDRDLLRHAVTANRLGEEALGCSLVPLRREEKVNGLAVFIHSAIEIVPLPFDLDVGLVHTPTDPHRPLATVERLLELWAVLDDPPVDGRVIDLHATFKHEFFDMACAQRVGDIPTNTRQNDLLWEMGPLEAHRHRLSPSLFTLSRRGRSYPEMASNENCDRTLLPTIFPSVSR